MQRILLALSGHLAQPVSSSQLSLEAEESQFNCGSCRAVIKEDEQSDIRRLNE